MPPPAPDPFDDDGPDLGPDERDMDLMDGSWEERYYAGRIRGRDWQSITVALALIALIAMGLPLLLVLFR